ncbi:subtilisin-like protease SBT4.14 [Vicia villosa]|uniref:subtilisin-like protease SBT4.14 n=1 Tax=Vicia villosa TaxID=3911 RepID=UPI00273B46CA|nr:subtilisin-like protease SBT4.14 [Vicia villosa]
MSNLHDAKGCKLAMNFIDMQELINLVFMISKLTNSYSLLWLPLLLILLSNVSVYGVEQKDFYIVFLEAHPVSREKAVETHLNILSAVKQSHVEAKESIVYSYTKSFNAFAAKLSEDEANKLSAMNEVVSVFPNQYRKLHTTRSWNFIGLPLTAKRKLKSESDTIVALLDTGITPEFQSFKDDGFGPPPAKWKGTCHKFVNFSGCNNKIIGARYFKLDGRSDPSDILSPIDVEGHGTHTASTAAGNVVPNASLFGLAKGTARGAVPSARLAIYKVCWTEDGCADMDILAAFEAAIHDGVDVISVSLGGGNANYVRDCIAIGAFHAMRKGIITVASAGNGGPTVATVVNNAPWIVTVAASGIDRDFQSIIEMGSRKNVSGEGVSTFSPKQKQYPLVNGMDAARDSSSKENAKYCDDADSLDPKKVKGKIVYCRFRTWGTDALVKAIGGIGTIVENDQFVDVAQIFSAPATFYQLYTIYKLKCKDDKGTMLVCTSLWKIWQSKNLMMFNNKAFIHVEVVRDTGAAIEEFSRADDLPLGCLSVVDNLGMVNPTGISACKRQLMSISPLVAEALGVHWGLELVQAFNFVSCNCNEEVHSLVGFVKAFGSRTWFDCMAALLPSI